MDYDWFLLVDKIEQTCITFPGDVKRPMLILRKSQKPINKKCMGIFRCNISKFTRMLIQEYININHIH